MNTASLNPTYERIRQTSVPITLLGESGRLVQWLKKPGDPVEKYEPLATIKTTDGVEMDVTAALPGVVKLLMFHAGTEVASGVTLCYVQPVPTTQPPPAPTPTAVAPSSKSPSVPNTGVVRLKADSRPLPTTEPQPPVGTAARRSTLGPVPAEDIPVEELAMPGPPAHPPAPRPTPTTPNFQRRKTTHKTYHIEVSQVARIKRLALELQLADPEPLDYNESELVRAAIEVLLALPRPALIATLQVNREREKQGCYGSGWPRPGKP